MKIRGLFVGLSVLALTISGCSSTSNSDEATQVTKNQEVADDRCAYILQTADEWFAEIEAQRARYDKWLSGKRSPGKWMEAEEVRLETQPMTERFVYLIIDNPNCFSPADVAQARVTLGDLDSWLTG